MIKAVFFDAAGTLIDAREPVAQTYARIARIFGVDAPKEAVAAGFRRAFSSAPPLAFGRGRSPDELRRLEREWWRELVARSFERIGEFRNFDGFFERLFAYFADPASWVADPEAAPTLRRLKECGVQVGVISNFDFRLYRILQALRLSPHLDSITISSEAGYAKPDAQAFQAALAKHSLEAREAMHVGDSEEMDLRAAVRAGLAAAVIDRGAGAAAEINGRTARIRSLASVIELRQGLRFA